MEILVDYEVNTEAQDNVNVWSCVAGWFPMPQETPICYGWSLYHGQPHVCWVGDLVGTRKGQTTIECYAVTAAVTGGHHVTLSCVTLFT